MCSSIALISITNIACMKSVPGSKSYVASLLNFYIWHCLHENSSSQWVKCCFYAWFPVLTLPAWNPIQRVSHIQLYCLLFTANTVYMKFHPACESCAALLLDFYCWIFLHKILSREWVMGIFAWLLFLTMLAYNLMQEVSHMQLLCLISMPNNACIKSHLGCESYTASLLFFHCWHCLHKIPSSLWVMCSSFAWFLLLTMPVWILSRLWVMCSPFVWFLWLTTVSA